jgi:hypothetical protein
MLGELGAGPAFQQILKNFQMLVEQVVPRREVDSKGVESLQISSGSP